MGRGVAAAPPLRRSAGQCWLSCPYRPASCQLPAALPRFSPACAVPLADSPVSLPCPALLCPPPLAPAPPATASPQVDAATLAGIRRQYADFLYAKRDYEQAMEQ
jgi:hypothetical protein